MPKIIEGNIIQIGETFGIEFETDSCYASEININNFRTTHDASCESDVYMTSNGLFLQNNPNDRIFDVLESNRVTIGTELVSGILNSDEQESLPIIRGLVGKLIELGESTTSERTGIHFHFSLPNPNLRILKSILRLGKYLESLFFTVGCMGYEFRGIKNDSIYCRPITKFGPPCVQTDDGYFTQVFNIYDVLKSRTVAEFWNRYGELELHGGRYNPVRYTWLNLYPLCPYGECKGTLEFRVFNKTLNPDFIYASMMLCKAFVNHAIKSSYDTLADEDLLHENSIYNTDINKETIREALNYFSNISNLNQKCLSILHHIIDISEIPVLPRKYVHTHINRDLRRYWTNGYSPALIDGSLIFKPKYVDIHVLRGEA